MLNFNPVNFIMPNNNPAACADYFCDSIVACDGICPSLCVFANNGILLDIKKTERIYRRIHFDRDSNRFVALAKEGCTNVFYLDINLNEMAAVRLEPTVLDCESSVVLDAVPLFDETDSNIVACNSNSIREFGPDGQQICFIMKKNTDVFPYEICFNGLTKAYHYVKNDLDFIEVTHSCHKHKNILEPGFSLRALIPCGKDNIAGLFGYRYNYNYILPILIDGIFELPSEDNITEYIRRFTNFC